jgi:hypothetical protein
MSIALYRLDLMLRGALFDFMEHRRQSISPIAVIGTPQLPLLHTDVSHVRRHLRHVVAVQGAPLRSAALASAASIARFALRRHRLRAGHPVADRPHGAVL